MTTPLTPEERAAALTGLHKDWTAVEGRDALRRVIKFKNFVEAWTAMSHIAMMAEKQNHHPEWTNVYGKLDVLLTTHDAGEGGRVTAKDIKLATAVDRVTASLKGDRDT